MDGIAQCCTTAGFSVSGAMFANLRVSRENPQACNKYQ